MSGWPSQYRQVPTRTDGSTGREGMSDILADLRAVGGGDTYSSAEVIGIIARAAAEIERLTRQLALANKSIECFEGDRIENEAEIERLREHSRKQTDDIITLGQMVGKTDMDTRYADAMIAFEDAVSSACAMANSAGITDEELAEELRRIASILEPTKKAGRAEDADLPTAEDVRGILKAGGKE
jgi:hypothetical protein